MAHLIVEMAEIEPHASRPAQPIFQPRADREAAAPCVRIGNLRAVPFQLR
jgi:hypothetical protein